MVLQHTHASSHTRARAWKIISSLVPDHWSCNYTSTLTSRNLAASEGGGSSSAPGSVVSLPGQFDYNVQQLFTFIGTVLSAWDGDNSSPPHSASSSFRSKRSRQPAARKRRDPLQFLLNGDLELDVAENLGSPIFKHKHWRIAAGSCNALFLRKTLHMPLKPHATNVATCLSGSRAFTYPHASQAAYSHAAIVATCLSQGAAHSHSSCHQEKSCSVLPDAEHLSLSIWRCRLADKLPCLFFARLSPVVSTAAFMTSSQNRPEKIRVSRISNELVATHCCASQTTVSVVESGLLKCPVD
ncbi:hypothetical protein LSTR_LSTR008073 [Laodelphax striatellus]|uniref:Uncharacterized protein n=1 Tax=Laodelphax striatellus TaxID=195883 RepID=A0A482WQ96_LAOST|nr:hypothetical protein LSTR_LSTR008073 [Laodelphax striatellus]